MILRKSFYIRGSAGRSPRVHEVNPGRDPSIVFLLEIYIMVFLFSIVHILTIKRSYYL